MKYLKQMMIILLISFAGEILSRVIPFNMPAGVYGIIILFLALSSGILPVESVEKTADFLLIIMPVLFVPAGVGLIRAWDSLKNDLFAIIVITVVSTAAVMAVTGICTQAVIRLVNKSGKADKDDE